MRYGSTALLLVLLPTAVTAQEDRDLPPLPDDVEERVWRMRNDDAALRVRGPVTIPVDSTIVGDVVAEDGTLTLAGTVTGDVLVVGGDLILGPGANIGGDVLVVGGNIAGVESATVGGTLMTYGPSEADDRKGDVAREDEDPWDEDWEDDERDHEEDDEDRRHRDRHEGGLDLGLSIAGNYNRVEGLPIMFGPVIESAGPNRLHVSGQAIWRTEPSESLDDEIGYRIRLEQGLFGDRLRIGGDARSMVRAIETHGLNSTEAGLAAALFHSDLHDYYDEQSWAARIELRPGRVPVGAHLTYRQAEHSVLEESDPWSLFEGGDDWRAQPVVAIGDVSTLLLGLTVDTRDDEDEPVSGFLAALSVEHALDQELTMPAVELDGAVEGGRGFDDFTTVHLDVRTHVPVNRSSTINLRGFLGGTVDEAVLPPQYQLAFGGIGTMPGVPLFEGACAARDRQVHMVTADTILSSEAMLPAYGCDRVALGQIEYRGGFGFGSYDRDEADDDEEVWWDVDDLDLTADWSFFVDVARGWSFGDLAFTERGDTETMADVGIGLLFDEAGVYAALPITGDDQSLRVVVRLQRRF